MKLIKVGGLIDDLAAAVARDELSGREFSVVKRYIMRQDAVDAVEVVRCKDCRYWDDGDCYRLELSMPTDFCSYGEKR